MVHSSELSGLTKKNSERPSESWRTIDQDTLKIKSLAIWMETEINQDFCSFSCDETSLNLLIQKLFTVSVTGRKQALVYSK